MPTSIAMGHIVARRSQDQLSDSTIFLSSARSLRFALRIALAMSGAVSFEKPDGFPRLRNVMRVPPPVAGTHVYVVSSGGGVFRRIGGVRGDHVDGTIDDDLCQDVDCHVSS
jgi:hypothetical protein